MLTKAGANAKSDSHQARLWQRWRRDADPLAREELLALHRPYARVFAASYYGRRVDDAIEFADYLQLAIVGLIESMDRFDPAVGVQFRTFAARRMHGALVDGIERMTEQHQQLAAQKRLEEQRRGLIKMAAASPSNAAPAHRLPEQALALVAEVGLGLALTWLLDGTGMVPPTEIAQDIPFYRDVELRQLRERIVELVRTLPPQERQVVHEHYFQLQRFDHIAERMRLTKGRISQIHKQALLRLRDALQPRRGLDLRC